MTIPGFSMPIFQADIESHPMSNMELKAEISGTKEEFNAGSRPIHSLCASFTANSRPAFKSVPSMCTAYESTTIIQPS